MGECLENMIFGLPRSHWAYVSYIEPGLPIFLFNYNDRHLHGVFRATSHGQLEINPHAWTNSEHLKTRFPAQVRVEHYKKCLPMHERPLVEGCYYNDGDAITRFVFELTKSEAKRLMEQFEKQPGTGKAPYSRQHQYAPRNAPVPFASRAPAREVADLPAATPAGPDADGWETVKPKKHVRAAGTQLETAPVSKVSAWARPLPPPGNTTTALPHTESRPSSSAGAAGSNHASSAPAPTAASATSAAASFSSVPFNGRDTTGDASSVQSAGPSGSSAAQQQQRQGQQQWSPTATPQQPQDLATPSWRAVGTPLSQNIANVGRAPPAKPVQQAAPDTNAEVAAVREALVAVSPAAQKAVASFLAEAGKSISSLRQERNALALDSHRLLSLQTENEELRSNQSVLLAEVLDLSRQLAALGLRAGIQVGGPSPALQSILQQQQQQRQHQYQGATSNGAPQSSRVLMDDVYLLGGNDGKDWLDVVEVYTPALNTWRDVPPMPMERGYGASVSLDGSIYVMGGGNGAAWLDSMIRLDSQQKWQLMAPMRAVRGSLGAVSLGGRIYAIGGGEPGVTLGSTEVYDPIVDAWMPGKSMGQKRFTTAAAELNGSIYVTGGYDEQYLSSTERLDPREGRWVSVAPMNQKRGSHACASCHGSLYAIGGWDSINFLSSVEMYDPRADAWQALAAMQSPRAYGAAASVGGNIFVAGGMTEKYQNDTIEVFNASSFTWAELVPPLERKRQRAFLTACVLSSS